MKIAEDNLYGEISIPLGISPDRVEEYIKKRMEKAEMAKK